MSISTLACRYGVNGQTLRKQYKEKISGYRQWDQLPHAGEYLLFPENVGADMSLDETCLSNGEVYTVLTDKSARGRKGALAAIIRGVATDKVSAVLLKLPRERRKAVRSITTDLSSAMMLTARRVFPAARLVNDRFHVQQLMSEAVDQLRIRFRWQVLEEENKAMRAHREKNKAMRAHREKRKAARSKQEREDIGSWEPSRMVNGETLPQIMARSRHIILKHESKWNEQQKKRAAILFGQFPPLRQAYRLSMKPTEIFNRKSTPDQARLNLASEFSRVLDTFENHNRTITNYFEERLTNASAESFNAKIKAFRSQFRGVGDIKFFMFRLATQYA